MFVDHYKDIQTEISGAVGISPDKLDPDRPLTELGIFFPPSLSYFVNICIRCGFPSSYPAAQ